MSSKNRERKRGKNIGPVYARYQYCIKALIVPLVMPGDGDLNQAGTIDVGVWDLMV